MTPQEFCYWLQGRAELLPDQPPTAEEWKMIREHLALTFKKVTSELAKKPDPLDLAKKIFEDKAQHPGYPPYDPFQPSRTIPSAPFGYPTITC